MRTFGLGQDLIQNVIAAQGNDDYGDPGVIDATGQYSAAGTPASPVASGSPVAPSSSSSGMLIGLALVGVVLFVAMAGRK